MAGTRIITRLQDQDDFSGSLSDQLVLKYDSALAKFVLSNTIKGATDANLFVIDRANDQVSFGSAPVAKYRKVYVQQNLTDAANLTGNEAIETRTDCQHATAWAGNASGLYGTLWTSGAGPFTGELQAVKGNAYMRPGCGAVDIMSGVKGRCDQESSSVVNAFYCFRADTHLKTGSGTVGIAAGMLVGNQTVGGNNFGILFEAAPSHGSIATTHGVDLTIVAQGAGGVSIASGGVTMARFDAEENLAFMVNGSTVFGRYGEHAFGNALVSTKTRNASPLVQTIVQNNDGLGGYIAYGSDGSAYQPAGGFLVEVDGTPGVGNVPGRLRFYTTAAGGAFTERMHITSEGVVSIGAGAPGASATEGELEFIGNGKGVILRSPAGTRFRVTVSDAGVLTTVAA